MIQATRNIENADFQEGALLLVDKPLTWTSFDVVNKLRYTLKFALKVKKIKVGHAGTLDPLATGLLLVCTGRYTKLISQLQDLDKTYIGSLILGAVTPSYDGETEITETFPIDGIDEHSIKKAAASFLGDKIQYPPAYSAVKIDGVPSYKRVRSGEEVKMRARRVQIKRFDISKIDLPRVDFEVECSKGTYIRSLVHDFGKVLNNGAYLSKLHRTETAGYHIDDAWNLMDLVEAIKNSQN